MWTLIRKAIAMPSKHILAPTDFSEASNQALDYAITFAGKLQARLTVLHVVELFPLGRADMTTVPEAYIEDLKREANLLMQSYLARITAAGLTGDVVIMHGTPFQEIMDVAKEQHADLIIMGTHGRTGLPHLLLGSVAERLVRLAPCPVLVVRPPVTPAV
jgi:nucleotide-binding universal stress UspA family protein